MNQETKYTAEQVTEAAETNDHPIPLRIRDMLRAYAATLAQNAQGEWAPIPMVLHCPSCGTQHIDAPESDADYKKHLGHGGFDDQWANPPHRSHLCHGCGTIWRPADVPTMGVAAIQTQGKADRIVHAEHARVPDADTRDAARYRFLRDPACRDHAHHTRRCLTVGVCDWGRNLDPDDRYGGMWSKMEVTGEGMDEAVDAAILAAAPSQPEGAESGA